MAALAIGAALGVHTLAVGLAHAKVPFAQPAAALLVVFDFTLVLMTGEDSSYVADRRSQNAAEVWTDEALSALPSRSLLLVRSEAVAWRLWAARVVRGERPDLVVVPLPLLDKGSVATSLLQMEPALAPLIREMSLAGRPNEYALSTLSDARPLYVELDPSWDRRFVDHVVPKQLWLGFAPHALGRSDRTAARERGRNAFERVLSAARTPEHSDAATLAILGARAEEQAYALAALGDRSAVTEIIADIKRINPDSPFASELEARMKKHRRGRVDVSGLLEYAHNATFKSGATRLAAACTASRRFDAKSFHSAASGSWLSMPPATSVLLPASTLAWHNGLAFSRSNITKIPEYFPPVKRVPFSFGASRTAARSTPR